MIPRSYLFVPADRPERIAKALASGADAVIVDLEDAVAPAAKDAARAALQAWLAQQGDAATAVPLLVRLNAPGTAWHEADRALATQAAVAGLMCPKAERPEDLVALAAVLGGRALLPLVESAEGLDRLRDIARVRGVQRLAFGSIDLQVDLGMNDEEALLPWRLQLVLQSRLAGLAPPVDGVSTAIDDTGVVGADARRARERGFGAKLCIHPKQVAPVNAAFTPSAAEVDWARRVLHAAEASGDAAVAVDGKMVDKPVLLRAQALLQAVR